MDIEEPKFEVPIIALEEALQLPLSPSYIDKVDFNFELIERLYFFLKRYHQENRIQPNTGIFRPNLSFVSLNNGVFCRKDFDIYKEGDYIQRNGDFTVPVEWIKRTLLFSHEVVIEDPIFSFCRGVLTQQWQEAIPSYSTLKESLLNIARLRPLLESRTLRITSFFPETINNVDQRLPRGNDGSFRIGDLLAVSDYTNLNILVHVGKVLGLYDVDANNKGSSIASIKNQLIKHDDFEWLYKQGESLELAYDEKMPSCPFLPNAYQLNLFKRLINVLNDLKVDYLQALYDLPSLTSNNTIDIEKITVNNLVNIRRDEFVFEEWRNLLSETINKARECSKNGFKEIEHFRTEIKDKERWWNSNFAKFKKEESYFSGILKETKLGVGAIGLGVGAIVSGGAIIPALAAGAGAEAVNIIYRCLNQFERYEAEKAAMSFFMSLE